MDFEQYYQEGLKKFEENDIKEAINLWNKAAELNPDSTKIFSVLGNAYKLLHESEANLLIDKISHKYGNSQVVDYLKEQIEHLENTPSVGNGFTAKASGTMTHTPSVGNAFIRSASENNTPSVGNAFTAKAPKNHRHPYLSIIIPIKDEEKSLPILYNKLQNTLKTLSKTYEIIFIDGGSRDGSNEYLNQLTNQDKNVSLLTLKRNFGKNTALKTGIDYAGGDIIITMDGDLQNDTEDIHILLQKIEEGFDLVNGCRKEIGAKKPSSFILNKIINNFMPKDEIGLNDFACPIKAYKSSFIKNLNIQGEQHKFIPAFAIWQGLKIAEIPVKYHPRVYGKSKQGQNSFTKILCDFLVTRFYSDIAAKPSHFFGKIAKYLLGGGTLLFILGLSISIFLGKSISLPVILYGFVWLLFFQLLIVGFIGDMLIRN